MSAALDMIVVIVDTDDGTYYEHHDVGTVAECIAFVEGMEAAWKISHGTSNCWQGFALGIARQREEWEAMGSPGRDKVTAVQP